MVEAEQDNAGDPGDTDFLVVSVATVEDTDDATWKTNCQAQLKFTTMSDTCLEGDFHTNGAQHGDSGEFSFEAVEVHTKGNLVMNGSCLNLFLTDNAEFAVGGVVNQGLCLLDFTVISGTCLNSGLSLGQIGGTTACGAGQ